MVALTRLGPDGSPRTNFGGSPLAILTGTIVPSIVEASVVTGGKTLIITLTEDTWKAAGTGPVGTTANSQAIIDGITSGQGEPNGWNIEVRDKEVVGAINRDNNTQITLTFTAAASYAITGTEIITVTIPTEALVTGLNPIVASPTFQIRPDALGSSSENDIAQEIPTEIPQDIVDLI